MNKITIVIEKYVPNQHSSFRFGAMQAKSDNKIYYRFFAEVDNIPRWIFIEIPLMEGSPTWLNGKTIEVEMPAPAVTEAIFITDEYQFSVVK